MFRRLSATWSLARLGATGIVPEIVEVSLQLGSQVLRGLGLADDEIAGIIAAERDMAMDHESAGAAPGKG
jgi:hypothetical protein